MLRNFQHPPGAEARSFITSEAGCELATGPFSARTATSRAASGYGYVAWPGSSLLRHLFVARVRRNLVPCQNSLTAADQEPFAGYALETSATTLMIVFETEGMHVFMT
jgi:hypothetical protein